MADLVGIRSTNQDKGHRAPAAYNSFILQDDRVLDRPGDKGEATVLTLNNFRILFNNRKRRDFGDFWSEMMLSIRLPRPLDPSGLVNARITREQFARPVEIRFLVLL